MKKDSIVKEVLKEVLIGVLGTIILKCLSPYINFLDNYLISIQNVFVIIMITIVITTLYFNRKINYIELKYNNIIFNLKKENNNPDKGNIFLQMALTVDLNNSLRNKLFEDALKYHNVYAGAYLGSIYLHGIEGKIEKDYKKAFNIFKSVERYDKSGLIYWFLGWMFEKGYIGKPLGKPNYAEAYKYYEKSKELGFIKAYNSIGKFNDFGNGIEVDTAKAIENYHKGAEMGDINAMLNLAFLLGKDTDKLKIGQAEKWFLAALENGSSLAGLRLGNLYMNNLTLFNVDHQKIADLFIKSINSGDLTEDKKACGYFWLSKLLIIDSDIDITSLTPDEVKDWYQYCTLKAYTLLFNLNEQGKHIGDVPLKIWIKLSESIKINI